MEHSRLESARAHSAAETFKEVLLLTARGEWDAFVDNRKARVCESVKGDVVHDILDKHDVLRFDFDDSREKSWHMRAQIRGGRLRNGFFVQIDHEYAGIAQLCKVGSLVCLVRLRAEQTFPDVPKEPVVPIDRFKVEVSLRGAWWSFGNEQ